MKRETVNFVRYLLEEWIPPALRDSPPMRWLFRAYWGRFVDDLEAFRANIHHVTPEEYATSTVACRASRKAPTTAPLASNGSQN